MIQFNELRIKPDNTKFVIDISVKDSEYYQNVFIDTVYIDTQDTFIDSGPSSKPVYTKIIEGNEKSVRLELSQQDISASFPDNMFFVWVRAKGTPSMTTPCGEDNSLVLGVTVDMYSLYQYSFRYIKEMEKCCSIPKGFINFILRIKALQISVETGNYIQAIKYWEKFFKNLDKNVVTTNCNCYGGFS